MKKIALLCCLLFVSASASGQCERMAGLYQAAIGRLISEAKSVYDTNSQWQTMYLHHSSDCDLHLQLAGSSRIIVLTRYNQDSIFTANKGHLVQVCAERVRIKGDRAEMQFAVGPTIGSPSEKKFGIYLKIRSRLHYRYDPASAMWIFVKAKTHIRKGMAF